MPWTPWRSTSSATRKASTIDVCLSSTVSSRSFGTTISVSTSSRQRLDAALALLAAARALEAERLRDDADGQRADFARDPRHDRGGAGAGAAAGAGGDEDHVRALQQGLHAVVVLHRRLRGRAPGSRPAPRPRVSSAPMWSVRSARRLLQRLQVGVDGEELDALDLGLDHAVDGVDAAAADADDADHGLAAASARPGPSAGSRVGRAAARRRRAGRSITFSGISEEKAWRRRSCGEGMRPRAPPLASRGRAGCGQARVSSRVRRGACLALGRAGASAAARPPRLLRSCGTAPPAALRACSRA